MIFHDKNKALMTVMSKRNPQTGERSSAPMKTEEVKMEDGAMDGKHAAAQDMMMALKEGSAQKFSEALSNHHDLHMAEPAKEMSEEDQPEVE